LLLGLLPFLHQGEQQIALLGRVEVENQPVPVGRHRCQGEQLRLDGLLQVDHQAHHARLVLADAHARDERVIGAHLTDQIPQLRAQVEPVDIDDQPRWALCQEVLRGQLAIGLDRDPGVVGGRPHPHRDDGRPVREMACGESQHQRAHARQRPTTSRRSRARRCFHGSSVRPSGVAAWNVTRRRVSS
jgi:hypothetical protein